MQTDPIGYKDDMDLYSYVGNDPVNKTDPTGLSCEQNSDGTVKSCKIDNGGEKLDKTVRATFENRMKSIANKLIDKKVAGTKVTLTGAGGKSFTTTYGAIGRSIIQRTANYDPKQKGGETGGKDGAPANSNPETTYGPSVINGTVLGQGSADRQSSIGIIHEGAHYSNSAEGNLYRQSSPAERKSYDDDHQDSFNNESGKIYDSIGPN